VSFVKRGVWALVTVVSIYLVIPSIVDTFSSWPELQRLREWSLLGMTGLMLASLVCFWLLLGLCLGSRRFDLMATSQLSSAAIARLVPGGSATATAVQYRLLKDAGVDEATAGTGLTVATLLNFAVLFALPVFSLPAIIFGAPIDSALVTGAVVAGVAFVGAAVLGGLFLMWDRPLAALGRLVDRAAARLGRVGSDTDPRAERYLSSRDLIRTHLADRWYWVVAASFGKWGFEYGALVLAVHGAGHDDTSSVLLLAFVVSSLLGRIPITPGGLGFVEAGLTSMLVLAGVAVGDAVLATLAFRLVSFWLPIPLGAVAYALHRVMMRRRRGVELGPLRDRGDDVVAVG